MDGRVRLVIAGVVALGFLALVPVGLQAKKAAAQDPTFCTNCHLMDGPWERWSESAHGGVTCVTCHPGDLQTDLRHGWFALMGRTEVRGEVGVDQHACERCHVVGNDPAWPRIAGTVGHAVHVGAQQLPCVGCHGSSEHVSRPASEVCARCHDRPVVVNDMTDVHCLDCHNFLGSGSDLAPSADTCRGCHRDGGRAPAVAAHGSQDCLGCHRPHASAVAAPPACEGCHSQDAAHPAAGVAGCTGCHAPHTAGVAAVARCAACHEPVHHGDVACTGCHPAHGEPEGSGDPRPAACATCHADLPGQHALGGHGACAACHDAHAPGDVAPDRCLACHDGLATDHATVGCAGCHTFHGPD